jgi:hypothetical protein
MLGLRTVKVLFREVLTSPLAFDGGFGGAGGGSAPLDDLNDIAESGANWCFSRGSLASLTVVSYKP